jgi:hypothetical protein
MTRVWARMILLVCLALTLGPASAVGATGRLSLNKPPWLVEGSGPSSAGSGSLPHTGDDLPRLVLTAVALIGAGAMLRVRASRERG